MRTKKDGVSVHAVAGSNVVLLGLDANATARDGLLGFAVHRTDHTEQGTALGTGFSDLQGERGTTRSGRRVWSQHVDEPGTNLPLE